MNMTHEQMEIFCKAMASGIAMGLNHRYECLVNAERMLQHGVYSEIPRQQELLWDAFIAFEKNTPCCGKEEEELRHLDLRGMHQLVSTFYKRKGGY